MKVLFLKLLVAFLTLAPSKENGNNIFKTNINLIDTPPPPPKITDTIKCFVGERPIMPSFVGGENVRIEYLNKNIKVDYKIYNDSFPRTVWVKTIIDTPGSVKNPKIVKNGVDSLFNAQIIKVFMDMPRWIPSEWHGQSIETTVVVPIKFYRKED